MPHQKKIREDSGRWSEEITSEIGKQLNYQKNLFIGALNEQILLTKSPIEEAIRLLEQDREGLDRKKAQLEEYRKEFTLLAQEGEKIMENL